MNVNIVSIDIPTIAIPDVSVQNSNEDQKFDKPCQ